MILGLLKEYALETRVALLPDAVQTFIGLKTDVLIEKQAGEAAFASDAAYKEVGAKIATRMEIFQKADVLLQIHPPSAEDLSGLKKTQVWISAFNPLWETALVKTFLNKEVTTFSLDSIPRTTRAQAMDILSSMATVAGYKAVLEAALQLPTFFPMFMTAAGTIRPANVLILGAGVAGLQAVAEIALLIKGQDSVNHLPFRCALFPPLPGQIPRPAIAAPGKHQVEKRIAPLLSRLRTDCRTCRVTDPAGHRPSAMKSMVTQQPDALYANLRRQVERKQPPLVVRLKGHGVAARGIPFT